MQETMVVELVSTSPSSEQVAPLSNEQVVPLSNEQVVPLSKMASGQYGEISEVIPGPFSGRLRDLGFVPGSSVQCRQKAPFGDPVEYEIRGSRFCLRLREAQNIQVKLSR